MLEIFERSLQDGAPYELYTFKRDTAIWWFTTRSRAHDINLQTYTPAKITRSSLEYTNELNKTNITLTMPRDNPVANLFILAPPGNVVTCDITRRHIGNDDPANEEVIWRGRILAADWKPKVVQLTGEPIFTSLRRVGLRRHYQRACPHVLYGSQCLVDKEAFKFEGTTGGVTGTQIQITDLQKGDGTFEHPDGWFNGGYIEFLDADAALNYQMILTHVGQDLVTALPPRGLESGMMVKLYAGCAHTTMACSGKFNNLNRFGGFPYIPTTNPFAGTTVF